MYDRFKCLLRIRIATLRIIYKIQLRYFQCYSTVKFLINTLSTKMCTVYIAYRFKYEFSMSTCILSSVIKNNFIKWLDTHVPHIHKVVPLSNIELLCRNCLSFKGSKHDPFFNPFPGKDTHLVLSNRWWHEIQIAWECRSCLVFLLCCACWVAVINPF